MSDDYRSLAIAPDTGRVHTVRLWAADVSPNFRHLQIDDAPPIVLADPPTGPGPGICVQIGARAGGQVAVAWKDALAQTGIGGPCWLLSPAGLLFNLGPMLGSLCAFHEGNGRLYVPREGFVDDQGRERQRITIHEWDGTQVDETTAPQSNTGILRVFADGTIEMYLAPTFVKVAGVDVVHPTTRGGYTAAEVDYVFADTPIPFLFDHSRNQKLMMPSVKTNWPVKVAVDPDGQPVVTSSGINSPDPRDRSRWLPYQRWLPTVVIRTLRAMVCGYLGDKDSPGNITGTGDPTRAMCEGFKQTGEPWWTPAEEDRLRLIFLDLQESHAPEIELANARAANDRTGAPILVYCDRVWFTDDQMIVARQLRAEGREVIPVVRAYSSAREFADVTIARAHAELERLTRDGRTLAQRDANEDVSATDRVLWPRVMLLGAAYDQLGTVPIPTVMWTLEGLARLAEEWAEVIGLMFFGWKRPPIDGAVDDVALRITAAVPAPNFDVLIPRRRPQPRPGPGPKPDADPVGDQAVNRSPAGQKPSRPALTKQQKKIVGAAVGGGGLLVLLGKMLFHWF